MGGMRWGPGIPVRSIATALFQTSYALGSIVAAWTTFGTFCITGSAAWRIPSALQALPSVLQLVGLYFDRAPEAKQFLIKYHTEGNQDDALVHFEFNEIVEALTIEKQNDSGNWLQSYRRFFMLIWCACICQMSGNAFIPYYLSPILTSQMLSWFSALYFATLPNKVGRRKLFLGALISVFICLIAITAGSAKFAKNPMNKSAGYAVVAFLYLFSPAYNLGMNGNLGLYITEIMPFSPRLRGAALFQLSQLCFIMLSVFAVPVGLDSIAWRFYIIFVIWVMIEFIVVYLVFPETKGSTLEGIVLIFDGKYGEELARKLECIDLKAFDEKNDASVVTVERI
ncbi:general substrate transporter [Tricladium varicosporioides]|nr:general substrate transporter [Hymenoscyphus varicosporioides]